MGSASLAAARPPARPPARTVTTIPLQPEGLRGKNLVPLFSGVKPDPMVGSGRYAESIPVKSPLVAPPTAAVNGKVPHDTGFHSQRVACTAEANHAFAQGRQL